MNFFLFSLKLFAIIFVFALKFVSYLVRFLGRFSFCFENRLESVFVCNATSISLTFLINHITFLAFLGRNLGKIFWFLKKRVPKWLEWNAFDFHAFQIRFFLIFQAKSINHKKRNQNAPQQFFFVFILKILFDTHKRKEKSI